MQRYGRVYAQYWTSADIIGLPIETKCIGAYLLSCHHGNMLGCFRLPKAYVVDDLRMGSETVSEGFQNLSDTGFLIYDSELSWVLIRNFLKWNSIENPNQGKAAAKLVQQVPVSSIIHNHLVLILKENPANFPDGFIEGFANGLETVSKSATATATAHPQPEIKDSCAAASAAPTAPAAATWDGQPITLQTVSGENWPVPAGDCENWASAYPATNVLQELLKMRAWLEANPRNRKTKSGMRRFIVNWLSRAQNQSRPNGEMANGHSSARGQARTNGNITAARVAADRMAARLVNDAGRSAGI